MIVVSIGQTGSITVLRVCVVEVRRRDEICRYDEIHNAEPGATR
jgi:hypothetical protein